MEIFGIGLPEILLIAVVALIVMGPDRLPEAARTLGKAVYDFRKAIEPARTAWEDVQKQISTGLDVQSPSTGRTAPGAAPSGNPWAVHPIAQGLSDEERSKFFKTGEIPEWKRAELSQLEAKYRNGDNSNGSTEELADLDYPMPGAEIAQGQSGAEVIEELDYPEPANTKEEETQA